MRAVVGQQTDLAVRIAEGDELFAEQHDAQWVGVWRWQLRGEHGRQPVLAHHIAHQGAGADPTQELVIFFAQHWTLPYRAAT